MLEIKLECQSRVEAFVESTINQVSRRFVKKTADAMDAARGPSFAADKDEGPQPGSGRPIPPLVSKIQVATTNAGARAEGGLTPDFLALSFRKQPRGVNVDEILRELAEIRIGTTAVI